MRGGDAARLASFEDRVAVPRQVLALAWLPLILANGLGGPSWSEVPLRLARDGIWLFFLIEYLWRLRLAPSRRAYAATHLFDLVALVFPPLRVLWAIAPVRTVIRQPGLGVFLVSTLIAVFASAGLVFALERHASGANIDSFGDALWWAFGSVTTVGYGDHTPVSGLGRSVAGGVILVGVVLYSVVTAHITAYVLDRTPSGRDAEMLQRLEAVVVRLERLEAGADPSEEEA